MSRDPYSGLAINDRGEIRCAAHVERYGRHHWWDRHGELLTDHDFVQFSLKHGRLPQCDTCAAAYRPVELRRSPKPESPS